MQLSEKHRPKDFSEIVGNQETITSLQSILDRDPSERPHMYLFYGQRGCGKTTIAEIFSGKLGCSRCQEINTSDQRGIDTAREIMKKMTLLPLLHDKIRVYVLNEVHQATKDFQNSLLTSLERPPKHVYFILCTTDPQKLLTTVRSRAIMYEMRPLADNSIKHLLKNICKKENCSICSSIILSKIAKLSGGSPRDAINLLEKVIGLGSEQEALEIMEQEAERKELHVNLCKAILDKKKWSIILEMLNGLKKENLESIRIGIVNYLLKIIFNNNHYSSETLIDIVACFMEPFYGADGMAKLIIACHDAWGLLKG